MRAKANQKRKYGIQQKKETTPKTCVVCRPSLHAEQSIPLGVDFKLDLTILIVY